MIINPKLKYQSLVALFTLIFAILGFILGLFFKTEMYYLPPLLIILFGLLIIFLIELYMRIQYNISNRFVRVMTLQSSLMSKQEQTIDFLGAMQNSLIKKQDEIIDLLEKFLDIYENQLNELKKIQDQIYSSKENKRKSETKRGKES